MKCLSSLHYLLLSYAVTGSESSCLARVAKLYPVSGAIYLPRVPNQWPTQQNIAHQVLHTIFLAKMLPVFSLNAYALFKKILLCTLVPRRRPPRSDYR